MSEPKFTPGPWLIEHEHSIDVSRVDTADNVAVADVYGDEHATRVATTRLIAAAPDMYEKLAELAEVMRMMRYLPIANDIDALLSKARGES